MNLENLDIGMEREGGGGRGEANVWVEKPQRIVKLWSEQDMI